MDLHNDKESDNSYQIPILIDLPAEHKRTYADVLFILNHWVRVNIRSDINNYYCHKFKEYNFLSAFFALWKPIRVFIKKGAWQPSFWLYILKQIVINVFFSFYIFWFWSTRFRRRKDINKISNKERIFFMIKDDYNQFSKREVWYNFDFLTRIYSYLDVINDDNQKDFLSYFNYLCSLSYLLIKVVCSTPLNFLRNKFGNIDSLYIVLEIEGEPDDKIFEDFGDYRYVGVKRTSFYIQVLKFRDLSAYLMEIEKPARLLTIFNMENIFVGCVAPKEFNVEEYLQVPATMIQELSDGFLRYVFEIKTIRAKTFLKKIQDTPIKLEGYFTF